MDASRPITIIGIGMAPDAGMAAHPVLAGIDVIIGGKRQLESVSDIPAIKIPIGADVHAVLDQAAAFAGQGKSVAVLASGDPLFFGVGATFAARFGADALRILPSVSSLQTAAAKLALPWMNVAAVSLHGRNDFLPFAHAVLRDAPVCLLTDNTHTPAKAAQFLIERGRTACRAHVFANLGDAAESAWAGTLEETTAMTFPTPNVVFFIPDASLPGPAPLCVGNPESAFAHENSLITKWPVRAAALAALRIESGHTVWDLGAGSGSVSIEAAALARSGHIVAVEKNENRIRHIEENRRRFGAANMDIVRAALPEGLAPLPAPHRVFIGGGLGGTQDDASRLLENVWEKLLPGGRVCFACVLLSGMEHARQKLSALGVPVETTMIQTSVSTPLGEDARLSGHNPVFLISAQKNI